jgi:hypothetical protein
METRRHLHTKSRLDETAAALEAERMAHRETQLQLQKNQYDADNMRKSWLEAANHLDRALRQGQVANQMTDDELTQRAAALRFKIKNFALQFFGDEITTVTFNQATSGLINKYLKLPRRLLRAYLILPSLRPMLVRAFLWEALRRKVFGRFLWALQGASPAMLDMSRCLSMFFSFKFLST